MPRFLRSLRSCLLPGLIGAATLSSCSDYYAQSVTGQLALLASRTSIDAVVGDPRTPRAVRDKLALILALRRFASQALGLRHNGSYSTYVHVNRRYVAWNVFATPEFSLEPLNWCFPVAGCLSYHGYFSEWRARYSAGFLSNEGNDVYVGGVVAYSTLGWFEDPVTSAMLRWSDLGLAELMFHELAHQTVYAPGDTAFNEAFATTVSFEGVRHWLKRAGRRNALEAFEAEQRHRDEFATLVLGTRGKLQRLYASNRNVFEKRSEKVRIFSELKEAYRALRATWGGYEGYDAWMSHGLNNAKLSSLVTYREHVRALENLFDAVNGRFATFHGVARDIARLDPWVRKSCLAALAKRGAGFSESCHLRMSVRHPPSQPVIGAPAPAGVRWTS
ncbi:MAG: aminopeptidase [Gammaproteobacteria bacterium]